MDVAGTCSEKLCEKVYVLDEESEFVCASRVNYKVSACVIFASFRVIASSIYWL